MTIIKTAARETNPLLCFVLKYFWRHSKRAPSRDQNLKGILRSSDTRKASATSKFRKYKLLRHLNPTIQSCNAGFQIVFLSFCSVSHDSFQLIFTINHNKETRTRSSNHS